MNRLLIEDESSSRVPSLQIEIQLTSAMGGKRTLTAQETYEHVLLLAYGA